MVSGRSVRGWEVGDSCKPLSSSGGGKVGTKRSSAGCVVGKGAGGRLPAGRFLSRVTLRLSRAQTIVPAMLGVPKTMAGRAGVSV